MTYTITSNIRGGGTGSAAWVAKITGPHPKFKLDRAFVKGERDTSRSGRSGTVSWHLTEPGIYEYRGVQPAAGEGSIGQLKSGFVEIDADGKAVEVTRDYAVDAVG